MIKLSLKIVAPLLLPIALLVNACDNKCDGIACVTAPPILILEFRDAQNRDLLNPATPNHIDTAKMKLLNGDAIRIFPPGWPSSKNTDRAKVAIMWNAGQNVTYLKISAADQDTILTNYESVTANCCTSIQLKNFSYNGKAFTDSVANRYFIIVK